MEGQAPAWQPQSEGVTDTDKTEEECLEKAGLRLTGTRGCTRTQDHSQQVSTKPEGMSSGTGH